MTQGWGYWPFLPKPLTLTYTSLLRIQRSSPKELGQQFTTIIIWRRFCVLSDTKAGPINKQMPQGNMSPLLFWNLQFRCTKARGGKPVLIVPLEKSHSFPPQGCESDFTGLPNGYKDKSKHTICCYCFCLWHRGSGKAALSVNSNNTRYNTKNRVSPISPPPPHTLSLRHSSWDYSSPGNTQKPPYSPCLLPNGTRESSLYWLLNGRINGTQEIFELFLPADKKIQGEGTRESIKYIYMWHGHVWIITRLKWQKKKSWKYKYPKQTKKFVWFVYYKFTYAQEWGS